MTAVLVLLAFIAAVGAGLAAYFFFKWQATLTRLHDAEKQAIKGDSGQALEERFKLMSQEVLERQDERSRRELENLLQPVRTEVVGFRDKVDEYLKESRSTKDILSEKFNNMDSSVDSLTKEAQELSTALRGNVKVRGDWGEVLLRSALENAGLREGESFDLQRNFEIEGKRYRPDAVLILPDNREIVIDAKVSLQAYSEYMAAQNDADRSNASSEMSKAFERQVEQVTKYHDLPGLRTPGFAIMFTPIEPAWQLMMREHQKVMEKAQRRGVMILGPVNLLAALRVVEHLWLADKKTRNVEDIVKRAEMVQDAISRLIERVEKSYKQMETAMNTLDSVRRAITGKQGVLSQAHKLQELGVKGKEELPELPGDDTEASGDERNLSSNRETDNTAQ